MAETGNIEMELTTLFIAVTMSTRKSSRVLKDVHGNNGRESKKAKGSKESEEVGPNPTSIVNPYEKRYKTTPGRDKDATESTSNVEPGLDTRTSTAMKPVYAMYYEKTGEIIVKGSLAEVEHDLLGMPQKMRLLSGADVKEFACVKDYNDFRTSLVNAEAASKPVLSPAKGATEEAMGGQNDLDDFDITRVNLGAKAVQSPVATKKQGKEIIDLDDYDIPDIIKNVASHSTPLKSTDSVQNAKASGSPEATLLNISPAAKSFSKYLKTRGMKCLLHYWPNTPGTAVAQVLFMDIIDTRQNFTHWLHRAEKWVEVFGSMGEERASTPNPLPKFFTQMETAPFRCPTGANVVQTKTITRDNGGTLILHRHGLYTFAARGHGQENIKEYAKRNMLRLLDDVDLQVCYRMIYTETSRNQKVPDLLQPRSGDAEGGAYWDQLEGAVDQIELVTHKSLDEVFLHQDVIDITKKLFQGVTDTMFTSGSLPPEIKAFTNGNKP